MDLLDGMNALFYVPLGFGVLLALGAALGLFEGGADAADGDGPSDVLEVGSGRLPLGMRLMVGTLGFGGAGLALSALLEARLGALGAALMAAAAAAAIAWGAMRALARVLQRRFPLLETEATQRRELVGRVGRVVLPATATTGVLQVHDARGNLHQVPCRTTGGERLPAGTRVVLVDLEDDGRSFTISRAPAEVET